MFHSTKLIAEASVPLSAKSPATAPKAKRPRRALWFAFGGLAIAAATVGAGWQVSPPACGCALPPPTPINLKTTLNPQQSRLVTLSGRAAQAAPLGSALANKDSHLSHTALRADAMSPGGASPLLSQPIHAGSTLPH